MVEGVLGQVRIRIVEVRRPSVKEMRPGRVCDGGVSLRSRSWTVMPRALPMLATLMPV